MPKSTKRTPRAGGYTDPGRKDPGHTLQQTHAGRAKRKDTKAWCKGKIGTPHNYDLTKSYRSGWWNYDLWTCSACGKKDLRKPTGT